MVTRNKKFLSNERERKRFRVRKRLHGSDERPRISVFKSSKHTYAQLISDVTGETFVSASTREKDVADLARKLVEDSEAKQSSSSKSVLYARAVGMLLAKRSLEKNIPVAVFDRGSYVYHGRVQAVAEGARAGGLKF